ncbi:TIGR03087 family PEP-CTERM/XrtA system glycosyltransferase [Kordiimonas marina]|uniref:TIGR03087 family PEP-CTERM/XrtA system glycosyltransferase n=1 Tax=Kordiimonas marina TaxID=2872312 RepID=UPI001FF10F6E|nr:TIGR03087 family PEP-CTERM/XrtA system glycosyltransferase [Kordiimonas marina]MCJ9430372.1 TIGR03087 family PEP-CTERM/XrtA system glycosyltransferase [Kordiimonas marina]
MARILFLAHRIPYPPNKGDKIRSWHFFEHLAQQHDVHLGFYVDDKRDLQHIPFLENMSASLCFETVSPFRQKLRGLVLGLLQQLPFTLAAYPQKRLKAYAKRLIENDEVDLVFLFSAATAPLVMEKDRIFKGLPVVADLVDMDSAKWSAYAARSRWPFSALYRREARLLRAFEAEIAGVADATVFVTDAEARLFRQETDSKGRVEAVPNGVDLKMFDPDRFSAGPKNAAEEPVVIFTGAMDYRPNVEAAVWFCRHVWPQVRRAIPGARFKIAGAPVAPRVTEEAAKADGVEVLGYVEDMAAEIAAADIAVAPLLTARGLQNKVLEGMAMAKPVIASPAALEGIEAAPDEDIMLADGPGDFASRLTMLLHDSDRRTALGANARRFVEAHHAWKPALAKFDRLIADVLERKG